jgi:hypothetical protein
MPTLKFKLIKVYSREKRSESEVSGKIRSSSAARNFYHPLSSNAAEISAG